MSRKNKFVEENLEVFSRINDAKNAISLLEEIYDNTEIENIKFDSKAAFNKFTKLTQLDRNKSVSKHKLLSLRTLAPLAAAAILLIIFGIQFLLKSDIVEYKTDGSAGLVIVLPDGSNVNLDKNSQLSYNKNSFLSDRKINLEGSALFDVEKLNKPFEVTTKEFKVSVLGTTFTVSKESVRVLEGKVRVEKESKNLDLKAGEASELINGELEKIKADFSDLDFMPQMNYHNEPLSRVLADIEMKFDVSISTENFDIENCKITSGSLANEPFDVLIKILNSSTGLELSKVTSNKYKVSKLSCQ